MALATALTIAKYIPDVIDLFDKDDKESVASKVVNIAKKVTGNDESDIPTILEQDPRAVLELRKAILEDKWVQERIDLDNVKSAREMHRVNNEQADKISDSVIKYNILFVILLASLNGLALWYFEDNSEVLLFIGNLIGFIIQALLKERQDILNFYFGSSLGSKFKQLQLNKGK